MKTKKSKGALKKIVRFTNNKMIVVAAYLKGKELYDTFNEMMDFYGNVKEKPMTRHELLNHQL